MGGQQFEPNYTLLLGFSNNVYFLLKYLYNEICWIGNSNRVYSKQLT